MRKSRKRPDCRVTCEQSVFSITSWVIFNQKVDMFLEETGTEVLTTQGLLSRYIPRNVMMGFILRIFSFFF